ncbi:hypothetical protein [Zavarzinella formosa]|uniref:hypothetical protein n=1 Tax=Zavarzinella formosa TaxID=360055 RepID=UPI00031142C9|nr:hypothetical protein [Zavarzinella formosa]
MEILCFGLFLLVLPVLGFVAVIGFLVAIHRTVKLVSPEHRQLSPGFVWCLLIPGVGFFLAVWMVWAVSESLRRQFEALGEPRNGGFHGLVSGMIWSCGQLTLICALSLAPFVSISSLKPLVAQIIIIAIMFAIVAPIIGWPIYWQEITEFKTMLEKHVASGRLDSLSQEEQDYGDDIGERKPESDDRSGTEG